MTSSDLPLVLPGSASALSRVLLEHAQAARWRFVGPYGQPVGAEQALKSTGFLPALMAGAVWECRLPLSALEDQRFAGFEEPTSHRFVCGFFLASDAPAHQWAFPILSHLRTHLHDGVVDLEPAWSAWTEAVRGTSQGLTFRVHLALHPDPKAQAVS